MIDIPTTIHIDYDGTLFDTYMEHDRVDGKYYYVCAPRPYSIEVTRELARLGVELICLTMGGVSDDSTRFLSEKAKIVYKHFPWISDVQSTPKLKQRHTGVKFLIDDTSCYLDDGTIDGIYMTSEEEEEKWGWSTSPRVHKAYSWIDVAILFGLIEEE